MPAANPAAIQDHATLHGRVVLITGGSRGLGAAIAATLGAAGMRLILADMAVQRVQDFAAVLAERDIDAIALPMDVSDPAQCRDAVDRVTQRFGRLDALVSNAAIDTSAPVQGLSAASWQRIVAANRQAPFMLSNHAVRLMAQQADGHIVNITSVAGGFTRPGPGAGEPSRCRLRPQPSALHAELRPQGVKVTALQIGSMRSFETRCALADGARRGHDPMRLAHRVRCILQTSQTRVDPAIG